MEKTNALRALDKAKIPYTLYTYESDGQALDARTVAARIEAEPEVVYKTLVAIGLSKRYYVLVIAAPDELDLKKCALALGEKSIELIPTKELLALTGYVRGGCSPVGMKKTFLTCLDQRALNQAEIIVSAGRIGLQMKLKTRDLIDLLHLKVLDLVR